MKTEYHKFRKEEYKRLNEKYGIKGKTKLTDELSGYNLLDYMMDFAERYRVSFPKPRKIKELKCPYCFFETEKENQKGLERHIYIKHHVFYSAKNKV